MFPGGSRQCLFSDPFRARDQSLRCLLAGLENVAHIEASNQKHFADLAHAKNRIKSKYQQALLDLLGHEKGDSPPTVFGLIL